MFSTKILASNKSADSQSIPSSSKTAELIRETINPEAIAHLHHKDTTES
jgi:hypothetical protein